METIHQRILRLRLAAGLSMEQLAASVGVTWQSVQQWEKNTAPSRKRVAAVAKALNVNEAYLLTGREERANSAPTLKVAEAPTKEYADRYSDLILSIADDLKKLPVEKQLEAKHWVLIELTLHEDRQQLAAEASRAKSLGNAG